MDYRKTIGNYAIKGIIYLARTFVEGAAIVYDTVVKGKSLDQIAEENPHFMIAQPDKKPESIDAIK